MILPNNLIICLDNMNEKRVGIGEVKVAEGNVVLSAYGIGSCVILIFYEQERKVGGLAHILLPVGDDKNTKNPKGAVNELLSQFDNRGIERGKIVAKLAGGATMFHDFNHSSIGKRNVEETKKLLSRLKIPIIAEDTLGDYGRTVFFDLNTGDVVVRSYKHGEKLL